ncbi:MAG: hypothetical protein K0S56_2156 [Microvirga sp.]|jgi:hypothetical protein|nr:hypothetical protein [Microvirga sp.]
MDPSRTRDPTLDVAEVADIIGITEMLLRSRLARGADSYVGTKVGAHPLFSAADAFMLALADTLIGAGWPVKSANGAAHTIAFAGESSDDVLVSRRLAPERYELVASPLADIGLHLGEAATVIAPAAIWRRVVERASTILEA